MDLQGPKLRVGKFADGTVELKTGESFRFDLDDGHGRRDSARRCRIRRSSRRSRPAPSCCSTTASCGCGSSNAARDFAECEVVDRRHAPDRKGVNVPDVVLPLSPLTKKDRDDLLFGLDLGADWVALSFVQRPDDVAEARKLIGGRAARASPSSRSRPRSSISTRSSSSPTR